MGGAHSAVAGRPGWFQEWAGASLISFMIHIAEMLISRLVVPVFVISLNAQFLFMEDICRFLLEWRVVICQGCSSNSLASFTLTWSQTHVVSSCTDPNPKLPPPPPRWAWLSIDEHTLLDERMFEADAAILHLKVDDKHQKIF